MKYYYAKTKLRTGAPYHRDDECKVMAGDSAGIEEIGRDTVDRYNLRKCGHCGNGTGSKKRPHQVLASMDPDDVGESIPPSPNGYDERGKP